MTDTALAHYRAGAFNKVTGWVSEEAIDALQLVSEYHDNQRISGDALEIGVFQGRFFLALMAALRGNETAVAVDIFDDQTLNIDLSGQGSGLRLAFSQNVQKFAAMPDMARMIEADSMCVRPEAIRAQSSTGAFRLISIDGGHTAEHVMNDLSLASQLVSPGGVVFLDDFHSPHWPGVFEGFIRFMMYANRNLAPVMFGGNKLLLTTISHQPGMLNFLRGHFVPGPHKSVAEVRLAGFSYIASS